MKAELIKLRIDFYNDIREHNLSMESRVLMKYYFIKLDKLIRKLPDEIPNNPLPKDIQSYKTELFSAYMTGQADVRDRYSGGDGRSFESWFQDNIMDKVIIENILKK